MEPCAICSLTVLVKVKIFQSSKIYNISSNREHFFLSPIVEMYYLRCETNIVACHQTAPQSSRPCPLVNSELWEHRNKKVFMSPAHLFPR